MNKLMCLLCAAGFASLAAENEWVQEERQLWQERTQGTNVAAGIPYKLIPNPDYRLTTNDTDCSDLTDGKLTTNKMDKLWFDSKCVGWYFGRGHSYIKMDLKSVQPIDRAVIRLLGGTRHNFKFPACISIHVSKDDKLYYTTASLQKLQPCESAQCDWKHYFYLDENRETYNTRVYPFQLDVQAEARYVIFEIKAETASIFSDELALIKAEKPGKDFNAVYETAGRVIPLSGLLVHPRLPEIAIVSGLPLPQNFVISDMRTAEEKANNNAGELVIELPKGVTMVRPSDWAVEELPDGGKRYCYDFLKGNANWNKNFKLSSPVIFLDAPLGTTGNVTVFARSNGVDQYKTVVPLKVVAAPQIEPFKRLHVSLSWMNNDSNFYDYYNNWKRLGFNTASTFPRWWTTADSVKKNRDFVKGAKDAGYKVIMNDSAFHEMVKIAKADKENWKEMYCLIDGQEGVHPCPSYRGKFYKMEMERVQRCVKNGTPDYVFYDIEFWHQAATSAKKCKRCKEAIAKSGLSLEDYLFMRGKETMADLKEAVRKGAEEAGIPMPVLGSYNRHAGAGRYAIERWEDIYPASVDMAMPSLYVCGRAQDVHNCIRNNYKLMKNKNIIPWLTAGTYGEFDSYKIEQMVLENFLNGANGVTYYEIGDFCDTPMDFYYHAKALEELRPYEDLVADGIPTDIEGSNKDMFYSMLRKDGEILLLVGNYVNATPQTSVKLPFKPKQILDVRSNAKISKGLHYNGTQFSFEVPKQDIRLFYIR